MSSPNKVIKHEDGTWHMSKERSACLECMNLNAINKYRKHQMGYRSKGVIVIGDCEFSEDSECLGSCTIIESSVLGNALAGDSASIYSSVLRDFSKVLGEAKIEYGYLSGVSIVSGKSTVINCSLSESSFIGDEAKINTCTLQDSSRVIGTGYCQNTVLSGQSTVEGGKVIGLESDRVVLHPLSFIHAGVWTRSPIVYKAQYSDFTVQECVDGRVHVGCMCGEPKKWLSGAGERYGLLVGLQGHQTDEIRGLVEKVVEATRDLETIRR